MWRRTKDAWKSLWSGCLKKEADASQGHRYFLDFLRHIPGPVFVLDRQGKILFGNEEFFSVFLVKKGDFLENITTLIDGAEFWKHALSEIKTDGKFSFSLKAPASDFDASSPRAFSINLFSLNSKGPDFRIGGIGTDLSDRHPELQSLRDSEDRFRRIFDKSPLGVALFDKEGTFVQANSLFLSSLGIESQGDLKGLNLFSIMVKDRLISKDELVKKGRLAFEASGEFENFYHTFGIETGRRGKVYFSVLLSALGHEYGFMMQLRDISDYQQAVIKLEEERELFKTCVEHLPVGVWVKDARKGFNYLVWNQVLEKESGLLAKDVVGRNDFDLFGEEDGGRFRREDLEILQDDRLINVDEYSIDTPKGVHYVRRTKFPVFDQNGHIFRLLGVLENITEKRRLEEDLRQAEKMQAMGQLAGGIAHDFNNQLAGILGHATFLKGKVHDEKFSLSVSSIINAAQRAADLTKKLLAYSRKGKILSRDMDLHLLINESIQLLEHSLEKNIVFKTALDAPSSRLKGDPSQIQNAIINLVLNAKDAMPDGGLISISTCIERWSQDRRPRHIPASWSGRQGDYICLQIADTGSGMSEEARQHIFEPFFTTKPEGQGTGMGLAAVYGTIRAHDGFISLLPPHQDGGTEFAIYFPLLDPHLAGELEEGKGINIASNSLLMGHVLIVDDEDFLCQMYKLILREKGHQVDTFCHPFAALDFFKKNSENIDLVVLDYSMPDMRGDKLFYALREVNPKIPVIVLSGFLEEESFRHVLDQDLVSYATKPISKDVFLSKIEESLKKGKG